MLSGSALTAKVRCLPWSPPPSTFQALAPLPFFFHLSVHSLSAVAPPYLPHLPPPPTPPPMPLFTIHLFSFHSDHPTPRNCARVRARCLSLIDVLGGRWVAGPALSLPLMPLCEGSCRCQDSLVLSVGWPGRVESLYTQALPHTPRLLAMHLWIPIRVWLYRGHASRASATSANSGCSRHHEK